MIVCVCQQKSKTNKDRLTALRKVENETFCYALQFC